MNLKQLESLYLDHLRILGELKALRYLTEIYFQKKENEMVWTKSKRATRTEQAGPLAVPGGGGEKRQGARWARPVAYVDK
jgi:hypothetical protein